MDKLLNAASSVAEQAFKDFVIRGGVIRDGARPLSATQAASFRGALTPILWMLREFIVEYSVEFPQPRYVADPEAMLGVSVDALEVSASASPVVFMLSDFIRNELASANTADLDLSLLFANFREWAAENVPGTARPVSAPGDQRPE